ncbi:unnamed protein product [Lactuca saligna]|uniref:Uncharacterized protein n=1 Tax=Lactuca saligna TaxID=75948 RepID=A0AA36EIS9_LACSI|nr:unnamed protein product [Lactuca saligna]
MPSIFSPNFEDLFINTSYAYQVKSLKLEILSSIATNESISIIFQELQDYVRDPDRRLCLNYRKENITCLMALGTNDGEVFTINATSAELKWKSSGHHHRVGRFGCRLSMVLESMEFCLKLRGSEACVLEDLAKAINLVHIRRDLVESGHALLNHSYHNLQEYERYEGGTGICDSDGIRICDSIPLPNKRS